MLDRLRQGPWSSAPARTREPAAVGEGGPSTDPTRRSEAAGSPHAVGPSAPARPDVDPRDAILVADDHRDSLALASFVLERSGYRVVTASDGHEALDLALRERPSLALLDVTMPRLDGLELTRRLRANVVTASIRVILLTARVQAEDVEQGFAAGAADYLRKPFDPAELRARVRVALARG